MNYDHLSSISSPQPFENIVLSDDDNNLTDRHWKRAPVIPGYGLFRGIVEAEFLNDHWLPNFGRWIGEISRTYNVPGQVSARTAVGMLRVKISFM